MSSKPIGDIMTSNITQRLMRMDKLGLHPRHILMMYIIKNKPGCNGIEIAQILHVNSYSCLQAQFRRLVREKWIEDRRADVRKASPRYLYLTEEGEAILNEIIG